MSHKKTRNKKHKQAINNKMHTIEPKRNPKLSPILFYTYSVILTLITLYSWFPKISAEPQIMYFDGLHDTFQVVISNNSFIPVHNITTVIDLKVLEFDTFKFRNNVQKVMDNERVLSSNKPTTVHFRLFRIGLTAIKELRSSDLEINISYRLPFLPISFSETHKFSAILDSPTSLKWQHK